MATTLLNQKSRAIRNSGEEFCNVRRQEKTENGAIGSKCKQTWAFLQQQTT